MGFVDLQLQQLKAYRCMKMYRQLVKNPDSHGFLNCNLHIKKVLSYPSVNNTLSLIVSLASCVFVGLLFYLTFSIKYASFPKETGTFIGLVVLVVVCAIQLLPMIRAVIIIAIPGLMTGQVRAIFMLMIVTWAFQVPAINVTKNIHTMTMTAMCVQDGVKGNVKEMKSGVGERLRAIPKQIFEKFLESNNGPFETLKAILKKVDESINKMLAWEKEMAQKIKEMLEGCEEDTRMPYYRCIETVDKMYYDCLDDNYEVICSPIKLLRQTCAASRVMTLKCEWPHYLKKMLEETVGTAVKFGLKKSLAMAKDSFFYQLYEDKKSSINDTIESAKEMELNVSHTFDHNRMLAINVDAIKAKLRDQVSGLEGFIRTVIWLLNMMVLPLFIWPFFTAVLYVVRFYRNPKYDNYFHSSHLEEVEIERRKKGTPTILPLMPAEKKTIVKVLDIKFSRNEKPYLYFSLVMTVISALVPLVIIMIDIAFFKMMEKSYKFFNQNLTVAEIPNHYELKVAGTGFMKELLQGLMDIFQPLHSGLQDALWKECFEEPSPPDYLLFELMLALFVAAIVFCFLQIYAKRWRHVIAERIFPEKIRVRALRLYNELVELRSTLVDLFGRTKQMLEDVDDSQIDDRQTQVCVRCDKSDIEIIMGGKESRVCIECNQFYCVECYTVITKCITCGVKLAKVEDEMEFYQDSSLSESSDDEMTEVVVEGDKEAVNNIAGMNGSNVGDKGSDNKGSNIDNKDSVISPGNAETAGAESNNNLSNVNDKELPDVLDNKKDKKGKPKKKPAKKKMNKKKKTKRKKNPKKKTAVKKIKKPNVKPKKPAKPVKAVQNKKNWRNRSDRLCGQKNVAPSLHGLSWAFEAGCQLVDGARLFEMMLVVVVALCLLPLGQACLATGLCGMNMGCGAAFNPMFRPACQSMGCGGGMGYNNMYNSMNPYSNYGGYNSIFGINGGMGGLGYGGMGSPVCGPYGCYRHRARASVSYKPETLRGYSNDTITKLNQLAEISPSVANNFVKNQKLAVNPNKAFLQCCVDRRLPDSCLRKCNFGVYRREMLSEMYMKKEDCPIEAMQEIHFCAAQGRDHRQCCERNGVSTTMAGEKCLVFCDQRPGKVVQLDMSYLPCFERFESMKSCFWNDLVRRH
ncbi:unnamed protein product [Bursaphelenchus okinawaensis]|uniref:DC_STAMP domain-containing protein n=1 Tax=Bursaphelenchus okinawaensis TaxID=465554 RepID=A0A811LCD7_9BILA|nr:unnamed protein product [Bursaphelenchus okinawaensis]CAG9120143.1 unnamed protein product [Bursaphelenchus okinawaensis]